MPQHQYLENLFTFINHSPTPFHVVANSAAMLAAQGFRRLHETDSWRQVAPGSYYVIRNDSSLIAFTRPIYAPAIAGAMTAAFSKAGIAARPFILSATARGAWVE